ncbi:hypothetical protein JP75_07585 [Devosia riboflavina]|uniref:Uncharacterized protein n=1 Tax=Devosia riboflavina TaxID=46914 RepID=A0A087M3G3_9HYPH|nr:hypothetical protein [Devosia riboflavina]KFL31416.1 hypothetical protein JP75_07585 [Devosia riboflavina]
MAGVQINLSPEAARHIQDGLSDLACWARGYTCGMPADDRPFYAPMGISQLQDINIALKGAISDFDTNILTESDREIARLRRWLHQIDEYCAARPGHSSTDFVREAALAALRQQPSPEGKGLQGFVA